MIRNSFSLAHKILIAFLLVLLPILVAFSVSYQSNKKHLEKLILEDLRALADDREGNTLLFLEMNKRQVQDFATDSLIRDYLGNIKAGRRPEVISISEYLLHNKLEHARNIHHLSVIYANGKVVGSTVNSEIGKDVSKEEFFLNGLKGVSVSEIKKGHMGVPELAITAPVLSRSGEKPAGVLAGYIMMSEFEKVLTGEQSKELGAITWDIRKGRRTLEIYLANRDRFMLTSSRFIKDSVLKQIVDTLPVRRCLEEKKEVSGFYRDYRGVEVAGASMCLPSTGWTLLVEVDKEEVLAPVVSTEKYTLTAVVVTVSFIGVLVIFFMRAVVAQLGKISEGAKEIASGNYDVNIPVRTTDEIGALSRSFNEMAREIRERRTELKRSEEKFRLLAENARDMIYRIALPDGRYEYVSPASIEISGYSPEEFYSTPSLMRAIAHPDWQAYFDKEWTRLLAGEIGPFYEYQVIHKSGETRWIYQRNVLIRDESGRPVATEGIITDITERKRAEEALRKSEASLANAQRIAHIGNWDWDIIKNELHWSDEIYRVFGLNPQEFGATYEAFLNSVHPDDREFVERSVEQAFFEGKPYSIDHRIVLPDGTVRVVHEQGEVAFSEKGIPVKMFGTIQDITERKKMEEAQARLTAILEATTDFVATADPHGRALYYNKAARRMLGIGEDEDISNITIQATHPEWAAKKVLEEGLPAAVKESVWSGETAFLSRDGREIPASQVIIAHKDKNGTVQYYSTVARDITERKRAEEALRRSEASLANAQRIAHIGNWDFDVVKKELRWSDEMYRIFGLKKKESGPSYAEFLNCVHPDDRELVQKMSMYRGSVYSIDYHIVLPGGDERIVHEQGEVTLGDNGIPVRMSGTLQDITERKLADEEIRRLNAELERRVIERTAQLEAANKELESFSYSVAHDLRAPLRIIDGFSQALLEDYAERLDEEGRDYLKRLRGASVRMAHLIDDLLDLSRVMRVDMRNEEVNLSKIARSIAEELRRSDPGRNVEFIVEEGLAAKGDSRLLRVVLENLLNNAWKFTAKHQKARIEFGIKAVEDGKKVYYVRDDGAGFNMKYAERLFGAFQRLHSTDDFPGTGVGLATVQRIIKRHGGAVWAEGAVEKGAVFYFTLPGA